MNPNTPVDMPASLVTSMQFARWNQVVAKRAIDVKDDGTHFRILHPTKGWRRIHKRRVTG
jgi:hypothetical protein